MRSIYSLIAKHENFFAFQNVSLGALTLTDMLSITMQIISMLVTVTSTLIMVDNHLRQRNSKKIIKNSETESGGTRSSEKEGGE